MRSNSYIVRQKGYYYLGYEEVGLKARAQSCLCSSQLKWVKLTKLARLIWVSIRMLIASLLARSSVGSYRRLRARREASSGQSWPLAYAVCGLLLLRACGVGARNVVLCTL